MHEIVKLHPYAVCCGLPSHPGCHFPPGPIFKEFHPDYPLHPHRHRNHPCLHLQLKFLRSGLLLFQETLLRLEASRVLHHGVWYALNVVCLLRIREPLHGTFDHPLDNGLTLPFNPPDFLFGLFDYRAGIYVLS